MSVITVTATVEASNVPPRVRLNVADTGAPSFATVNITRLDPNGETVPVRTTGRQPADDEQQRGARLRLRDAVRISGVYSSQETPGNVTTPVTVPETRIWLVHPGVPAVSMPIELRAGSLSEESYPVTQGVFYPMGRKNPVVVNSGVRHGPESKLTVAIDSVSDLAAIRALVADAGTLLLNIPPGLSLGFDTSYIAVSDIRASRLTDIGSDPVPQLGPPLRHRGPSGWRFAVAAHAGRSAGVPVARLAHGQLRNLRRSSGRTVTGAR
jgi:hypothetical protein